MDFWRFAAKNVHRNIRAYFAYFLSSSISAALMFSFTMLILHPDFNVNNFTMTLESSLYVTTVISYLFLSLFVFYSVSVFLKSRYKEFGILYTLGASKSQVNKIICMENIIISSLAAVSGIIMGLVFSKILLAASGKLLGYNALKFYFPTKAMLITLVAFVIIGIVISMSCSFIVREDKVLILLKGTKAPRTEPRASVIAAGICVALLISGYYLAVSSSEKTLTYRIVPVTAIVVAATYLLFSQLSIFIIRLLKKNREFYMKKTTMLWVSDLLYRVRDNTRMFFLITITSTVALSSIGAVYAYWTDKENQIDMAFPAAFFCINGDNNKARADFIENSLKNKKMAYTNINDEIKVAYLDASKDEAVVIKENTYRKLATSLNIAAISFNENETVKLSPLSRNNKESVVLDNIKLVLSANSGKRVLPALYRDVYVVKDGTYERIDGTKKYFCEFNVKNYKNTLEICKEYESKFEKLQENVYDKVLLKADILEKTKIGYGVILFGTIFIGLIFFVTTGSFLYNKCYMDVLEDKKKYGQLNKIGMTYKEIDKILTIEIGVLFLFPYIVAAIHSCFALSALKYAFQIPVTGAAFLVMGSIMLVQIVYFFVIRESYLREVKKGLM